MKFALLPIALTLFAQAPQQPDSKPAPKAPAAPATLKVGDKLPDTFSLKDLDGNPVTAQDLKGKTVCFVFWSIQCPIMIANEHKLVALHQALKDHKDVLLFAVNANVGELGKAPAAGDKGAYAAIRDYMKDKGMAFRVLADHGNAVADLLAARTTPHSFVFDKNGVLRYAGGFDDDQSGRKEQPTAYTREAIDACVAGTEVKTPTSAPWGCTIKRAGGGGRGRR